MKPNCKECPLNEFKGKRKVPIFRGGRFIKETIYREVPYKGNTSAKIVIVGESPGAEELEQGQPFVGPSGKLLDDHLKAEGINPEDLFFANACRCLLIKKDFPEKKRTAALKCCRPKLEYVLKKLKPELIVCCGGYALQQVIKLKGITSNRGKFIWSDEFGCWVFPIFHPAYCLRDRNNLSLFKPDMAQLARFMRGEFDPGKRADESGKWENVDSIRFLLEKKNFAVAIDTETQGLDWTDENSVVISYSVSDDPKIGYNIWLLREARDGEEHDFTIEWPRKTRKTVKGRLKTVIEPQKVRVVKCKNYDQKLLELAELLMRKDIKKVMMNGNYDLHRFRVLGIPKVESYVMDIQVAFHLLDPDSFKQASLKDIQTVLLPDRADHKTDFGKTVDKGDLLSATIEHADAIAAYAATDAAATLDCAKAIAVQLKADRWVSRYYNNLAHPVTTEVLYDIEKNGILFDVEGVSKAKEELSKELKEHEEKFLSMVPRRIKALHEEKGLRLTRYDFVRDVFFHKSGFGLKVLEKTDAGLPSINRKLLLRLKEEVDPDSEVYEALNTYIEWGPLNKLYRTYINGYMNAVRGDGRLHTQISISTTATGRTSSSNPNLQNTPKRNKKVSKIIRKLLIAPPGKSLVAVDYSQQELRWIAHRSQDPEMLRVYREGKDIHERTALALLGVDDASKVDPAKLKDARTKAKSVNFGLIYGMRENGFIRYARDEYGIILNMEEAARWRMTFFNTYPRLLIWHDEEIDFARKHKCCYSPLGFRRLLPNIDSDDFLKRSEAERLAINTPIQNVGSSSTLLAAKIAKKYGIIDDKRVKLVLFIHDELVFEVEDDHVDKFIEQQRKCMEELILEAFRKEFGFEMTVPLKAEFKVGRNLAEMREVG